MCIDMQGYNGSQLWDTAFTAQAIVATNLIGEYGPTLKLAHEYIKNTQVCSIILGHLFPDVSIAFSILFFIIIYSKLKRFVMTARVI